MTQEQLIEKFNPANAKNLTPEDFAIMQNLTDEQIDVLANAYPNQPNRKAYIRLFDKNVPANKQLYNLSTWQNLRNLRKFNNKKNLIAWDFFNVGNVSAPAKATAAAPGAKGAKKIVDLTAQQAADELKKSTEKVDTQEETTDKKDETQATNTEKVDDTAKAAKKPAAKAKAEKKTTDKKDESDTPADQQFSDGSDNQ